MKYRIVHGTVIATLVVAIFSWLWLVYSRDRQQFVVKQTTFVVRYLTAISIFTMALYTLLRREFVDTDKAMAVSLAASTAVTTMFQRFAGLLTIPSVAALVYLLLQTAVDEFWIAIVSLIVAVLLYLLFSWVQQLAPLQFVWVTAASCTLIAFNSNALHHDDHLWLPQGTVQNRDAALYIAAMFVTRIVLQVIVARKQGIKYQVIIDEDQVKLNTDG